MMNPDALAELTRLEASFQTLRHVVAAVPTEALDRRWSDGKWTPREHVAHLVRYQTLFLTRLRRIVEEDTPLLPRYRSDDDPAFRALAHVALPELFARAELARAALHDFVRHLDPAARARSARHPLLGLLPIPGWVDVFLVHEGHHAYAILLRSRPE